MLIRLLRASAELRAELSNKEEAQTFCTETRKWTESATYRSCQEGRLGRALETRTEKEMLFHIVNNYNQNILKCGIQWLVVLVGTVGVFCNCQDDFQGIRALLRFDSDRATIIEISFGDKGLDDSYLGCAYKFNLLFTGVAPGHTLYYITNYTVQVHECLALRGPLSAQNPIC